MEEKPYTTLKKIVKVTKSKVSLSQERGFCFQNSNIRYYEAYNKNNYFNEGLKYYNT